PTECRKSADAVTTTCDDAKEVPRFGTKRLRRRGPTETAAIAPTRRCGARTGRDRAAGADRASRTRCDRARGEILPRKEDERPRGPRTWPPRRARDRPAPR